MGYMCGKAHHRTSPPEQSWIESLTCTQLSEPATPKSTESTSFSIAGCNKKYQKHHRKACSESNSTLPGHHVARARITSETAGFGISFHYPFNLFHPFHSYSLQYSTIILDKLSQFITKHVAARGSPIGNATTAYAPNGIPSEQPPIASPLAAAPACLHSHDTGCRPFPSVVASASENQPHSSSSRASVGSSTGTLAPGGGFTSPPSSSPSSFLSFDPFAAPVAYIGSTATSTGCTKVASSSSSSPLSELASSLLSSPSHASPAAPAPSFRRPDVSLQLPSTAPPITHLTSSSTSSLTSATATATTTTTSTSTSTTTARPSSSHYLVRHSLCLYAASSVILALCYLTIPTVASEAPHTMRGKTRFAEGKSDKEILDHLLKGSRYDKRLLPPVDGSLTVNISVLLLSLASPDESSLKYEVEFLLQQQWYDPRLRYANHSQYEFLNAIHHHEDIWLPDTYFIMHGDFKDPIIPMHFALRIYRNGTINYLMRRHLILSCQGRLNIFPFDDPLCSFALESISYEQSAIRYVWKNDEDTLRKSPSLTTLNAYLIQNQTITCPIKASWRGVTTMLNFFTTSNGFRSTLPVVSNLTAMNVWDGVCMCFIYASLLEFVCVNYVGRKRPLHNVVYRPGENPVTQRLPAVLNRIGIILASPLTSRLYSETIETEFRTAIAAEKPVTVPTAAQSTTGSASPSTIGSGEPKAASRPASILVEEGVPLNDATTKNRVQRQPTIQTEINEVGVMETSFGVKKRDSGGPNEIVACTSCAGGTSPCTHSANNGCATETCFVQVRKKEPPHPIRVAKTIDVIARITFPSAYAVFLIFFFIHYKGFS
ncbi:gamma-aminobutyric acid receptor subunit alpha-4 isoform X17 [Malaya genurostris]|uniref:gamma-aminobutyric acid receptor subunit alpha-4 isoform X17 n=1 Tax=Malaya genurostris TaxID=325434 RepID=UPI0026F3AFD4|nr:gamma-aminobutyric acid receptor subunit alpha-4 isoform X17 [Malaya genurostris]